MPRRAPTKNIVSLGLAAQLERPTAETKDATLAQTTTIAWVLAGMRLMDCPVLIENLHRHSPTESTPECGGPGGDSKWPATSCAYDVEPSLRHRMLAA